MDTLLDIQGLSKTFGAIKAVNGIGFSVGRGEVLGFLGPNGAGKSTTMRMVAGYLTPSAGRIEVCGFDVAEKPIEIRKRLGYLPEGAPAYGDMTPSSLLAFVADIRKMTGDDKQRRIDEVTEQLELGGVMAQPIETLSKGFKRRVGLATTLLHDPDVLILDEPTDGLDPNQKHQVRTLLSELAAGKAIIISTHILEEVDAICSRAIIIARGKIVADAKPTELLARSRLHNAVAIRLQREYLEPVKAALEQIDGVAGVKEADAGENQVHLVVLPKDGANIINLVRQKVGESGVALEELFLERGRLDDVFRDLTKAA
ncbi:MAG: ABC transporter ATP-binding protein [Alphaproteobacteria bacterium]|nr:ABC transporter ATP-binding protein [Alphaproteobacteria bacterium]